jgi:hypothetical protein
LENFATGIQKMQQDISYKWYFRNDYKTMLYWYITNWLKSDQKMKYNILK